MTKSNSAIPTGDFTIFGFTKKPERQVEDHLSGRLGITPITLDLGNAGCLFFYTSYADVVESEEAIVIKLGFLRSPTQSPISAKDVLWEKMIQPFQVDSTAFRGNALLAYLSKNKPLFSVFRTLIAVPQLYYHTSENGIICSDRLRCVTNVIDHVELNQEVLPMHFLFRSTPGNLTYFRHVQRMLPGEFLKWYDGQLSTKLMQDLHFRDDSLSFSHYNSHSLDAVYESLRNVVGDYVTQIEECGQGLANLLSGGVDSSILQLILHEKSSSRPSHSFSYAAQAPSFEFEIANAREASQLFQTEHTFIDFQPEDYPRLLLQTTDILGQPPVLATEPSILTVAEFAQRADMPMRFFFSGQAADALFGLPGARKLKGLAYLGRIPGASLILRGMGTLLKPIKAPSRVMLKGAEILTSVADPHAFASPSNTIAVYADVDTVRRCFGDKAVVAAFEYRRELATQYRKSNHQLEKVYTIDLITDAYEVAAQRQQLFLAYRREQVHPFLDEDVLRVAFAFPAHLRYIKGFQSKYLLKAILERETDSMAARKPKGFSIFQRDLYAWMRSGPLHPLILDIELPGFLNKKD